jgi:hypothetical protein
MKPCHTLLLALVFLSAGILPADELHAPFDRILKQHVTEKGMVDYRALHRNPEELNRYLESLGAVTEAEYESWGRDRQLAFLINLYNAATLKLIVDQYPVDSIKDIGGWLSGPWDQKMVPYLGDTITLNHLEHDIIRKEFAETPETHFALVCAAIGCPPLRREAYTADHLAEQFASQKRIFLSNTEKNRKNADRERLHLSPIFKWYAGDFEKVSGSVQNYLAGFWPEVDSDWSIRYTHYDWSLNIHE